MRARRHVIAIAALISVAARSAALAQAPAAPAAPAPPAPCTIWTFMGFKPVTCDKIKAAHVNKKGCHPEKEKKPLLKAIADPENLQSKNLAIQAAAQVKTEEDLAQQKIKALKYLGAVGCGCYPGVKEALLAALDDCTEEVRFAAATALIQAAGACCGMQMEPPPPRGLLHLHQQPQEPPQPTCGCGQTCCDLEVKKKLADVAFEKTAGNCWKEPSARVRAAAAQALALCNSRPTVAKDTEDRPQRPAPETIPSPSVPETAPDSAPETAPVPPLPGSPGPLLRDDDNAGGVRRIPTVASVPRRAVAPAATLPVEVQRLPEPEPVEVADRAAVNVPRIPQLAEPTVVARAQPLPADPLPAKSSKLGPSIFSNFNTRPSKKPAADKPRTQQDSSTEPTNSRPFSYFNTQPSTAPGADKADSRQDGNADRASFLPTPNFKSSAVRPKSTVDTQSVASNDPKNRGGKTVTPEQTLDPFRSFSTRTYGAE